MRSFYSDTVTRVRPVAVDGAHGVSSTFTGAVPVDVPGVRVQHAGELGDQRRSGSRFRVLGPADVDFLPGDRVTIPAALGGWVCTVVDRPARHRGPSGGVAHSVTMLEVLDL